MPYLHQFVAMDVPIVDTGPENTVVIDISKLLMALIAERRAWRADNGVYSVPLMLAHGKVIEELEKLIDFGEGKDDDEDEGEEDWYDYYD